MLTLLLALCNQSALLSIKNTSYTHCVMEMLLKCNEFHKTQIHILFPAWEQLLPQLKYLRRASEWWSYGISWVGHSHPPGGPVKLHSEAGKLQGAGEREMETSCRVRTQAWARETKLKVQLPLSFIHETLHSQWMKTWSVWELEGELCVFPFPN